eukprot:360751-Chlamydomonas_euryale.AAC.2
MARTSHNRLRLEETARGQGWGDRTLGMSEAGPIVTASGVDRGMDRGALVAVAMFVLDSASAVVRVAVMAAAVAETSVRVAAGIGIGIG